MYDMRIKQGLSRDEVARREGVAGPLVTRELNWYLKECASGEEQRMAQERLKPKYVRNQELVAQNRDFRQIIAGSDGTRLLMR